MKKSFLLGLLMIDILTRVFAQDGFISQTQERSFEVFDHNGKSFVNPAPDIAGSPYLKAEWMEGSRVLMNNRRYDSVKVRLNLNTQEVHYLARGDNELALARGYIKEVIWAPAGTLEIRYRCGFPPIDAQNETNFYAVLSEGKMEMLQSTRKIISQRKDELSGEIKKEYLTYDDYYVYDGRELHRLKKDHSFMNLLADKKEKIEAFAKERKLKFKSTEDIKQVIDFYNSLP